MPYRLKLQIAAIIGDMNANSGNDTSLFCGILFALPPCRRSGASPEGTGLSPAAPLGRALARPRGAAGLEGEGIQAMGSGEGP